MDAPRPIMLHGTVGGPATWVGQEGAFAGAAAIALPGFPVGDAFADVDAAVDFIADLLERVPGPRVLVGHELGAGLAIATGVARPDLVDGVVISGLGADGVTVVGDDADAAVAGAVHDTAGDAAAVLRRALEATPRSTRERSRALAAGLDVSLIHELRVPALAVVGAADTVVTPADVVRLVGTVPDAIGAIVPDALHLPMADTPVAFNLLVAGFLARVEVAAAT